MTHYERDAWALGYKLYEEYAEALRQAATRDDDGDTARRVFGEIQTKVKALFDASDHNGRVLSVAVYDVLEKIYIDARKRGKIATGASAR